MKRDLEGLNLFGKPTAPGSPDVGQAPDVEEPVEPPRWRRPPKGYVARRSVVRLTVTLTLVIVALAAATVYYWWNARQAQQAQAAAEQRVSRLFDERQALEQENQGLKQATQGQIASLTEKLEALAGPQLNWPVFDVYSLAFFRQAGRASRSNEIELPPTVNGFSLILNPESQTRYPDHRLEIIDSAGQIVWQSDGLQRNRLGSFNITLTRELLSQDRYSMKVYGKAGTRLRLLDEFPIVFKQTPTPATPSPRPH